MKKILPLLKSTLFFNLLFFSGCTVFHSVPDIKVKADVVPRYELIESAYLPAQLLNEPHFIENLMIFLEEEYSLQTHTMQSQYPDIINALVINSFLKEIYLTREVDEKEMIKFYNDNIDLFREHSRYELIVVFTPQRRLGLDFLRKMQEGKEFLILLEDKEPEIQKVLSGWYSLQDIPVFLHESVKNLEPGKTSGLLQSGDGYYIVRLSSLQHGRIYPFSMVKEEIHGIIVKEKMIVYLIEKVNRRK